MMDLVETIGLQDLVNRTGIHWQGRNFEEFYCKLHLDSSKAGIRKKIESHIFDYFENLQITDKPCLYDYLVLSLRAKDVIATFNWDPFLMQACKRNARFAEPPSLIFLHGNTGIAYRMKSNGVVKIIPAGPGEINQFSECQRPSILWPVTHKDYQSEPFIKKQWEWMREVLGCAFVFTIFGYGAPRSDVEATRLMAEAWGPVSQRNLEETEIIDLKSKSKLERAWKRFYHSHHYRTEKSFCNSILRLWPRRSVEGIWAQTQEILFIEANPIPKFETLVEMHDWFKPLIIAEQNTGS
jgi:hypothetical protein